MNEAFARVEVPAHSLEYLLNELFDQDELRRFLAGLDRGASIVAELPGPQTPRATLAHEAARLLRRRGDLSLGFFAALQHERPGQRTAIHAVAERVLNQQSSSETLRLWQEPATPSAAASPRSRHIFVSLLLVLGLAATAATWQLVAVPDASWMDVDACTIHCTGCHGVARAWIKLDDGGTYVVDVEDNKIRFRCLREGTKFIVVLAVRDGHAELSYRSTELMATGVTIEITPEQLSLDISPGVVAGHPSAPKRFTRGPRPRSKRTADTIVAVGHPDATIPEETPRSDTEPVQHIREAPAPQLAPPSTLDPSRDTIRPSKPILGPTRPHRSRSECNSVRARTYAAHDLWDWAKIIELTEGPCWRGDPEGLSLMIHALKETKQFELCIQRGRSASDKNIAAMVTFCRKRL